MCVGARVCTCARACAGVSVIIFYKKKKRIIRAQDNVIKFLLNSQGRKKNVKFAVAKSCNLRALAFIMEFLICLVVFLLNI